MQHFSKQVKAVGDSVHWSRARIPEPVFVHYRLGGDNSLKTDSYTVLFFNLLMSLERIDTGLHFLCAKVQWKMAIKSLETIGLCDGIYCTDNSFCFTCRRISIQNTPDDAKVDFEDLRCRIAEDKQDYDCETRASWTTKMLCTRFQDVFSGIGRREFLLISQLYYVNHFIMPGE